MAILYMYIYDEDGGWIRDQKYICYGDDDENYHNNNEWVTNLGPRDQIT